MVRANSTVWTLRSWRALVEVDLAADRGEEEVDALDGPGEGVLDVAATGAHELLELGERGVGVGPGLLGGGDRQLERAHHAQQLDEREVPLVLQPADDAGRAGGRGGELGLLEHLVGSLARLADLLGGDGHEGDQRHREGGGQLGADADAHGSPSQTDAVAWSTSRLDGISIRAVMPAPSVSSSIFMPCT